MVVGYCESTYEAALMDLLAEEGWQCTNGETLHRAFTETLIVEDIRGFLLQRYPDLTPDELERVILNLRNTSSSTNYLSLREVFELCRNGFNFKRDDPTKNSLYIEYMDFDHPERNTFRAVNQFTVQERGRERRPDVLLFVNGIPLVIIELKNPASHTASISDAWDQIHIRYRRDIPSLMKFCALSCISDGGATRLGTTYAAYEHYYAWKKVENEENAARGLGEMPSLVKGAFAPARLLEILRDFIYFPDIHDGQRETEVVCRYPQYFGVHKLYDSVLHHLRERGGDGKGGTYFGATGCGKTFTMLFLARRLIKRSGLSPTILIIVDREDLESQSGKLFESSKDFLGDASIRCFDSRQDLKTELLARRSGGVFVTTVQKFCEETGELSQRGNIICFSDEAHRSQLNLGETLELSDGSNGKEAGAYVKLGFAQYLHDALPNATFVGFTGTPIEETVHVFGPVVDKYTMSEAVEDGITVPLKYEARLARVMLDTEKAKEIEAYYSQCGQEGTNQEDIARSQRAMTKLDIILGDDERLHRMAKDIAEHYEKYVAEHPDTVTKAMVVSSTREIAYKLWNQLKAVRPEWFEPMRVADETAFYKEGRENELQGYAQLPMVNLVATRGNNDPAEMYDLLGNKEHRQMLDREFKKVESNFRIAIVVDMWITGFDVPTLGILYNDKPLRFHTLIQTISRVNRKYPGKEYGLIVDYIGIRQNMERALKQYGGDGGEPADIEATRTIFENELATLEKMLNNFDSSKFRIGTPIEKLRCLSFAAEFVLSQPSPTKETDKNAVSFKTLFKGHVKRLKYAFGILQPSGALTRDEVSRAQFFMAVQSIISKTSTSGSGPDVVTMNKVVEQMVAEALQCTGVETVLDAEEEEELFSEKFAKELAKVPLPFTKFQLLVKALRSAIKEYARVNKVKAQHFEELLQRVVDEYNTRDKLIFTNEVASSTVNAISDVVTEKVNSLSDKILEIFARLRKDRGEFKRLGITFEEKAFFDILVDQRNTHGFEYPDEKCLQLARAIKKLIDNSALYADWLNNDNVKAQMQADLTVLLYKSGYPPEWDDEIFKKVMSQVNNFKTYQE